MYACVCNHLLNITCLVTDEEDPEKGHRGNKQKKDKQKKIAK